MTPAHRIAEHARRPTAKAPYRRIRSRLSRTTARGLEELEANDSWIVIGVPPRRDLGVTGGSTKPGLPKLVPGLVELRGGVTGAL